MLFIFAAEIVYLFGDSVIGVLIYPSATLNEASFWHLAEGPIAPQIVTGYPLLGIIICVVLLLTSDPVAQKALPGSAK